MKQDSDEARETWRFMIHVDSIMGNNNLYTSRSCAQLWPAVYPLSFNDFLCFTSWGWHDTSDLSDMSQKMSHNTIFYVITT